MLDVSWLRTGVLITLFINLGGISAVLALYVRAYAVLSKDARSRRAGLTPLHVVLVSAGVLMIQTALGWGLVVSLGHDATWDTAARTAMYGVGSVLINASMVVMGRMQTRRKLQFERCHTVTVQQVDTIAVVDDEPPS